LAIGRRRGGRGGKVGPPEPKKIKTKAAKGETVTVEVAGYLWRRGWGKVIRSLGLYWPQLTHVIAEKSFSVKAWAAENSMWAHLLKEIYEGLVFLASARGERR